MGFSYSQDDQKMCFNPAKNWQLDWYRGRYVEINPQVASWGGEIVGVGNQDADPQQTKPIVLKVPGDTEDYYIGYNHAVGFNADTEEAANLVTVVSRDPGSGRSQSWREAELGIEGTYVINDFKGGDDLTIKVIEIDLSDTGYAYVQVWQGLYIDNFCSSDSDCNTHECATGTCNTARGSCTFDPSSCPGGSFSPTQTPSQEPTDSYPFLEYVGDAGSPASDFPLQECQSDCDGWWQCAVSRRYSLFCLFSV